MRRWLWMILLIGAGGCEAFTTDVNLVARAGDYELTVDRLATIMAEGKSLPLENEAAKRVAELWVDYAIFAQRIARGEPIMDSSLVMAAMWRDVQQTLADRFYEEHIAGEALLDSAAVDSIYRAGDYRYIRHILVRAEPDLSPVQKQERRERARQARSELEQGRSWESVNERYNDDRTRDVEGVLGVIARGETVTPFETAAFQLEPGEISDVTETSFGFHLIHRPELEAVRDSFWLQVEDRLVARRDTAFLDSLTNARRVRVSDDAPALVRQALEDFLRAKTSGRVLASYDGGRFTVADFTRWFQGFPPEARSQVPNMRDDQIQRFVRELTTSHILLEEARSSGIELDETDYYALRTRYRDMISAVRAMMNITDESLGDTATTMASRMRQLEFRIDQYLQAIAKNERQFISMPPYLADSLRATVPWRVVPAGVERAVERATELRAIIAQADAARARGDSALADSLLQSEGEE